ncbi:MAG TPA: LPS export ABC transporter permease LptG [Nitrospiraceae bacterium]|jgi:lipopolysaccharide export system permease protein|nr:LPS export ABC transporter permease LptG [Nitrospiraceae bacterium]
MTILFRYLVREYMKVFLMCFAGLMTVYLVVDFFEKGRRFIKFDWQAVHIVMYFLLRTPGIAFQIAPLAVLMATLLTLGMLSRNHEVTAMQSCGISLARTALPFLVCSTLVALGLFILSAVVIPVSNSQADYVKTALIEKKNPLAVLKSLHPWIQLEHQTLMNIEAMESDGLLLRGLRLYRLGPGFRLLELTEAKEARYTGQGWTMSEGITRILLPNGVVKTETFTSRPVGLSHKPEDFRSGLSVESEEMTLQYLKDRIERLRRDGYQVARLLTEYHGRIAFPFVSIVMAVVGVALSLKRTGSRGGGMAIGIGQALVIGFLYWTAHSIAISLGRSGIMLPMLAGWLANLLFLSYGSYLYLKVGH